MAIADLTKRIAVLEQTLDRLRSEIEDTKTKLQAASEELAAKVLELARLHPELEGCRRQLAAEQASRKEAEERNVRLQKELDRAVSGAGERDTQIARLRQELDEIRVEATRSRTELEQARANLRDRDATISRLQVELEEARRGGGPNGAEGGAELNQMREDLRIMRERAEQLQADVSRRASQISELKAVNTELLQRNAELLNDLASRQTPTPFDPQLHRRAIEIELGLRQVALDLDQQKKDHARTLTELGQLRDGFGRTETLFGAQIQKSIDLQKALTDLQTARPALGIEEAARNAQESITRLNLEAQAQAPGGGTRFVVDTLEMEIKGGLDLKEGIRLTQLQGKEVGPETVSTLRFALKPAQVMRIADVNE